MIQNKNLVSKESQTAIDVDLVQRLINEQKKTNTSNKSHLLLGIEGDAKTGKSGITMDTGIKTFYLDCDEGAVPTWKANHNSTDRILIFNPAAYDEDGEFLPYQTQGNIRSFIALVKNEIASSEEPILFVWDGVDTWLDYCTLYMTGMENSRMRKMKATKQQEWFQRNQPYREVLKESLKLNCHQIYITHTKPPFRDDPPQPIWNRLDSRLYSIISTKQRITAKGTEFVATVKSSKYYPSLVGKNYTFLTVARDGSVDWTGIDSVKEMKI